MKTIGHLLLPLATALFFPSVERQSQDPVDMGVGMVKPHISSELPLYFYGSPANNPYADPAAPNDSLTFAQSQYYIDIATAPPWLQPEVLKLDYDLLYFRAVSVRRHWIEVIVNRTTGQTAWVNRQNVEYKEWSEFLLNVFAVEVIDTGANPVRVRPLDNAGLVINEAEVLYPLTIRGSWMQVTLDMDGKDTGWIKWKDGDRLLVTYSLLS